MVCRSASSRPRSTQNTKLQRRKTTEPRQVTRGGHLGLSPLSRPTAPVGALSLPDTESLAGDISGAEGTDSPCKRLRVRAHGHPLRRPLAVRRVHTGTPPNSAGPRPETWAPWRAGTEKTRGRGGHTCRACASSAPGMYRPASGEEREAFGGVR